ncbi:MAG: hypothetical protein K2J67_07130 [Lachnospiraceae bacterium]|nr:hypothetical protein [Lachnospiraceae bacterium]
MEEKNQRMEKETMGRNICRLVRIHLIQKRNPLIGLGASVIIYFLFITVCVIGAYYGSNNVRYYEIVNGYGGIIWTGILYILILEYQLFTNEAISMYPGNAVTRFLGRIIADHIQLIIFILCVGMASILQCGLLQILLQGKAGLETSVIFDIRYLGTALLQLGAYAMALYGVFAFFLALDARFGNRFRIALLVGIFGMVYGGIRYQPRFMMLVWGWIQKDHTELFPYIGVFLLIWLVCLLASGILACFVRCWKIGCRVEYIVVLTGVCFVVWMVLLMTGLTIEIESEDGEEGSIAQYEPGDQYGAEDLYSSALIELPEDNAFGMDEDMVDVVDMDNGKKSGSLHQYINGNDNVGFNIGSKSEAAGMGIPGEIDLSGIDEEHGMLIFQVHDVRINGQDIYWDLMEDLQKNLRQVADSSKIKLEYAGKLKSTVCFDFFPSTDRFLYHDRRDMTMREYVNRQPYLLTTLLISDARYEEFERAMDE